MLWDTQVNVCLVILAVVHMPPLVFFLWFYLFINLPHNCPIKLILLMSRIWNIKSPMLTEIHWEAHASGTIRYYHCQSLPFKNVFPLLWTSVSQVILRRTGFCVNVYLHPFLQSTRQQPVNIWLLMLWAGDSKTIDEYFNYNANLVQGV